MLGVVGHPAVFISSSRLDSLAPKKVLIVAIQFVSVMRGNRGEQNYHAYSTCTLQKAWYPPIIIQGAPLFFQLVCS